LALFEPQKPPQEEDSGEPEGQDEAAQAAARKKFLLTVGASCGVVLIIIIVAVVLGRNREPEQKGPEPMDALEDISIKLIDVQKLIDKPPTYVIQIEIANKSPEEIRLRLRDFKATDLRGMGYRPTKPTAESDIKDSALEKGKTVKGSLNFELDIGSSPNRLIFQDRGWLSIE
jgi:hypothetical protein